MKGGENQWEGNGKIRPPLSVSPLNRGAFFHIVPLNTPVGPVLMIVPLGMSHQLGCSERRRGAAACFPHKPAATRCKNKPWSVRRPSIVGNRPRLRKQGGDTGVHYCFLLPTRLILLPRNKSTTDVCAQFIHNCEVRASCLDLQPRCERNHLPIYLFLPHYGSQLRALVCVFRSNRYLIKFLSKLTEHQDVNKMTPGNIAIVLGPNLLWMNSEG